MSKYGSAEDSAVDPSRPQVIDDADEMNELRESTPLLQKIIYPPADEKCFKAGWIIATLLVDLSIPSLLTGVLAGGIANAVGGSIFKWYNTLDQPSWAPQPWIMVLVFITTWLLIGLGAWMAYFFGGALESKWVVRGTLEYYVQLILIFTWIIVFYGAHRIGIATIISVIWYASLLVNVALFFRAFVPSGVLASIHLIWATFVMVLNFSVWHTNCNFQMPCGNGNSTIVP